MYKRTPAGLLIKSLGLLAAERTCLIASQWRHGCLCVRRQLFYFYPPPPIGVGPVLGSTVRRFKTQLLKQYSGLKKKKAPLDGQSKQAVALNKVAIGCEHRHLSLSVILKGSLPEDAFVN